MRSERSWEYDDVLRKREAVLRATGFDSYCLFAAGGVEVKLAREFNALNEGCLASPFLRT